MSYSQLQRREIYSARESPRTSDSAHTQPAGRCCRRGGARSSQLCLPLALGCFLCPAASGLSSQPAARRELLFQRCPAPAVPSSGEAAPAPRGCRGGMRPAPAPGREPSPGQELSRIQEPRLSAAPAAAPRSWRPWAWSSAPGLEGASGRGAPGALLVPGTSRSAPGTDSPRCSCQQRFVFSSLTQIVTSHCRPELRDLINI